jgi:hypothetical protein
MFAEYFESAKKRALRASEIEAILGADYDLDRLRELVEAERLIGKEIWAKENTLRMFRVDTGKVERAGVQYASILKNGEVLIHTKTCAIPVREVGKTVFLTREAAEAALKGEQNG